MKRKPRGPARSVDTNAILEFIKRPGYAPMRKNDLRRKLGVPDSESAAFKRVLKDLVQQGQLVKVRKTRYAPPGEFGLVTGTLRAHENGFGFVVAEKPLGTPDVFIPPPGMSTAMHMDKVVVRLDDPASQRDPSKGPSGTIVKILERGYPCIVGTLQSSKQFFYIVPDDPRMYHDVYVGKEHLKGAKTGDRVFVRITAWPSKHVNPEGVVEEVLGPQSDPSVDLKAIIRKYGYNTAFPQKVLDEAAKIPQTVPAEWLKDRVDLRNETVLTIDPEDAKDYDDAISLKKGPHGWILGVHIADVSFYVKEKGALDEEARGRGTSVYLPTCVLPMLPESLSNGVCSLKEKVDRLTKTVLFHCAPDATIKKVEVFPSVIRSVKRFTYAEVLKIITEPKPEASPEIAPLVPLLKDMNRLAETFHKIRVQRGSLMLNIPKVKVLLDENYKAKGVRREVQDAAHSLIEEFMLLANEAVARYIMDKTVPGIYRVHEQPDKQSFEEFAVFAEGLGYKVHTGVISPHEIQTLLARVKDKPEEPILHIHLLRSMKLAVYSSKNLGHFALGLAFYTHFTSPIRRYPDLIVHRVLDRIWARQSPLSQSDIGGIAAHSSKMERMADEAERELSGIKILQYLAELAKHHSRRAYRGIITAVKSFGFIVELEETLVPGMVHLSGIRDDFYDADIARQTVTGRRRHRKFRLGQEVEVRIEKVDLAKRQVDLALV